MRSFPRSAFWLLVALAIFDVIKHAVTLASGLEQPWGDSIAYWNLGSDIAAGDVGMLKSEIGYRTLGYPWFVGVCQLVGRQHSLLLMATIQQAVALATNGLIAYWAFRITRSPWLTIVAYSLAIANTSRTLCANWVLTETLSTFFILSIAIFAWHHWRSTSLRHVAELSMLIGVAILIRPSSLAFLPLLAAFVLASRASRWKSMALAALALVVLLSPCYVRNFYLFEKAQLVTFQGRELWTATFSPWPGAGLSVPEDGAGGELLAKLERVPDVELSRNWSVSPSLARLGMRDADIDGLMARVAWQAMRSAPGRVAYCFLARNATYWYCWNWPVEETPAAHVKLLRAQTGHDGSAWSKQLVNRMHWTPEWFPWTTWGLSLATWLGVAGMLWLRETRLAGCIMAYVMLAMTLLTAFLEIPNYRYRLPIEPVMVTAVCVGLGGLCVDLGGRWRSRRGEESGDSQS
jgi:hypothetical protein